MQITMTIAPFTGAWIETPLCKFFLPPPKIAPFTGAWIETLVCVTVFPMRRHRTLHGCVD